MIRNAICATSIFNFQCSFFSFDNNNNVPPFRIDLAPNSAYLLCNFRAFDMIDNCCVSQDNNANAIAIANANANANATLATITTTSTTTTTTTTSTTTATAATTTRKPPRVCRSRNIDAYACVWARACVCASAGASDDAEDAGDNGGGGISSRCAGTSIHHYLLQI